VIERGRNKWTPHLQAARGRRATLALRQRAPPGRACTGRRDFRGRRQSRARGHEGRRV